MWVRPWLELGDDGARVGIPAAQRAAHQQEVGHPVRVGPDRVLVSRLGPGRGAPAWPRFLSTSRALRTGCGARSGVHAGGLVHGPSIRSDRPSARRRESGCAGSGHCDAVRPCRTRQHRASGWEDSSHGREPRNLVAARTTRPRGTGPLLAPTPHPSGARPPALPAQLVPRHVAVVMDGNGRWAKQRGLPRTAGHEAGEASLLDCVHGALELGHRVPVGLRVLHRELEALARTRCGS